MIKECIYCRQLKCECDVIDSDETDSRIDQEEEYEASFINDDSDYQLETEQTDEEEDITLDQLKIDHQLLKEEFQDLLKKYNELLQLQQKQ